MNGHSKEDRRYVRFRGRGSAKLTNGAGLTLDGVLLDESAGGASVAVPGSSPFLPGESVEVAFGTVCSPSVVKYIVPISERLCRLGMEFTRAVDLPFGTPTVARISAPGTEKEPAHGGLKVATLSRSLNPSAKLVVREEVETKPANQPQSETTARRVVERRSYPRHPCTGKIRCRIGPSSFGRQHPGELIDISETGARFSFGRRLRLGELLQIEFAAVGYQGSFAVAAETISVRCEGNDRWQVRCRFENRVPYDRLCALCR